MALVHGGEERRRSVGAQIVMSPSSATSSSAAATRPENEFLKADWESMTDEEFECFLSSWSMTTCGIVRSRFLSQEEYDVFQKRRSQYLLHLSDKLSDLYDGIDLVSMLRKKRDTSSELITGQSMALDAFVGGLDFPPYKEEKQDLSMKQRRKRAMESTTDCAIVPGTDCLFTGPRKSVLYLPRNCRVAIDSCMIIYMAQCKQPQYKEKGDAVRALFNGQCEIIVSESAFMEITDVLLRESKHFLSTSGLSKGAKREIYKVRLKEMHNLYVFLASTSFSQGERGQASYLNVLRLCASRNIKPYDARLILEGALPGVHVFLTEDCHHSEVFNCVREEVLRKVMIWHALKHKLVFF